MNMSKSNVSLSLLGYIYFAAFRNSLGVMIIFYEGLIASLSSETQKNILTPRRAIMIIALEKQEGNHLRSSEIIIDI